MRRLVLAGSAWSLDPEASTSPGTERSRMWTCDQFFKLLKSLRDGGAILAPRGLRGPDEWLRTMALRDGVTIVEFASNGRRYKNGRASGEWAPRWFPEFASLPGERRPLARNRALVSAARAAMEDGWSVEMHAFLATWAKSAGVSHLARCARQSSIRVIDHECPVRHSLANAARQSGDNPRTSEDPGPQVYFLRDAQDFVKIGWTTNLSRRIRELQTAQSGRFHLLGSIPGGEAMEAVMHRFFSHYHARGEWFVMGARLRLFILRVAEFRRSRGVLTEDDVLRVIEDMEHTIDGQARTLTHTGT